MHGPMQVGGGTSGVIPFHRTLLTPPHHPSAAAAAAASAVAAAAASLPKLEFEPLCLSVSACAVPLKSCLLALMSELVCQSSS